MFSLGGLAIVSLWSAFIEIELAQTLQLSLVQAPVSSPKASRRRIYARKGARQYIRLHLVCQFGAHSPPSLEIGAPTNVWQPRSVVCRTRSRNGWEGRFQQMHSYLDRLDT